MRLFQESPRVNGGNRFIFQSFCSNFFSRAIDNGLKTMQTDKNLDRYIERLSSDYRPSVDQLLTDTLVKYRPTIGEVSAKSRRSVGEREAISAETHLERLSTVSRPSVDRLSTAVSTDYRPSVDRLSTECRPTIDRVSLPRVNKIQIAFTHSTKDSVRQK